MDRKQPPFGGPPANGQPFARRAGPPGAFGAPPANESGQQAPPQQTTPPAFGGFQGAKPVVHAGARRGWNPARVGGRHDSPLYGKHRKRPSSTSIDSNVSWSGSEIESIGGAATYAEQQQAMASLSWPSSSPVKAEPAAAQHDLAPAAALFSSPATSQISANVTATTTTTRQPKAEEQTSEEASTGLGVQPPKTPLGKPAYPTSDNGLSAAQRVRMGLSTGHAGSRAGSRANSSENVFVANPSAYDEEKNGPQSCPTTFSNGAKQPQFSLDKLRQLRSNETIAAKLLPNVESSVNSLMGYVRELQMSEATLRKQLVKTKQHTEEELNQSLSKVTELEKTMQEVERDREEARRKLEEQEQLIRDLAAKLKQAEAAKAKAGTKSAGAAAVDELPPIAEEANAQSEVEAETKALPAEVQEEHAQAPALTAEELGTPPMPPHTAPVDSRADRFGLASPRSPNRPLWDPWATGGATPMKNLPPVFNIGATGLDPVVSSGTPAANASTAASVSKGTDYELRSVLMSPRRTQSGVESSQTGTNNQQNVAAQQDEDVFAPQYPAPVFNVGAMPSPSYPSSETRDIGYGAQAQDEVPLMESPSQATPMLPVEGTIPDTGSTYDQQQVDSAPIDGGVPTNNDVAAQWNGDQVQQEMQAPPAAYPPPVAPGTEGNEGSMIYAAEGTEQAGMVPPPAEGGVFPPQEAVVQPNAYPEGAELTQNAPLVATPEPQSSVAEQIATSGLPMVVPPPMGMPPQAPGADHISEATATDNEPPRTSPPSPKQSKTAAKKPVSAPTPTMSLEELLVDFFTEVDEKRLKMAKVYGKRYAGREKWLFAELTKRYGASKVAALKARYEGGGSESLTSSGNKKEKPKARSGSASEQTKAPRQGHPRHPQFFHPPTPATGVDLSGHAPPADAAVGPSSTPAAPQEAESAGVSESSLQAGGESISTSNHVGEKTSPGRAARVSPRPRRSGGNIPPFSGPVPPSFATPQGEGVNEEAPAHGAEVDGSSSFPPGAGGPPPTNGPPMNGPPAMGNGPPMAGPPPMMQRDETEGESNHPPFGPPRGFEPTGAAPAGLRQRRNVGGAQAPKQPDAAPVTLEGLLKELYKEHQPDKLKNVAIVAKQYAGKERELVGLLKGKYGAASVKHLEANLEVLERAHRARVGNKSAGKKRGCFVCTVSLMFWLSVLLFLAFGAVLVSFVVLDAQECRALLSEEEPETPDECAPLKKELETFTYERVGAYVRQSHPEMCFCSEWKARESALLSNLSGDDLVGLAQLLPFSPDAFGEPWIASVKEQVPSQEFYESYAKPVVDLSLEAGSFVWSSVLELTGLDDSTVAEVKSDPVVIEDNESEAIKSDAAESEMSETTASEIVEPDTDKPEMVELETAPVEADDEIDVDRERELAYVALERERELELARAVEGEVESGDRKESDAEIDERVVSDGVDADVETQEEPSVAMDTEASEETDVESATTEKAAAEQESIEVSVDDETHADSASAVDDESETNVESLEEGDVVTDEVDAASSPRSDDDSDVVDEASVASHIEVDPADVVVEEVESDDEVAAEEAVVATEAEEEDEADAPVGELEEEEEVTDIVAESTTPAEVEGENGHLEDDSVDAAVMENESANEDSEDAADIATVSGVVDESAVVDEEQVVEMEVQQEGVDLSYAETDGVVTNEVEATASTEDVSGAVDEEAESVDIEDKDPVSDVEETMPEDAELEKTDVVVEEVEVVAEHDAVSEDTGLEGVDGVGVDEDAVLAENAVSDDSAGTLEKAMSGATTEAETAEIVSEEDVVERAEDLVAEATEVSELESTLSTEVESPVDVVSEDAVVEEAFMTDGDADEAGAAEEEDEANGSAASPVSNEEGEVEVNDADRTVASVVDDEADGVLEEPLSEVGADEEAVANEEVDEGLSATLEEIVSEGEFVSEPVDEFAVDNDSDDEAAPVTVDEVEADSEVVADDEVVDEAVAVSIAEVTNDVVSDDEADDEAVDIASEDEEREDAPAVIDEEATIDSVGDPESELADNVLAGESGVHEDAVDREQVEKSALDEEVVKPEDEDVAGMLDEDSVAIEAAEVSDDVDAVIAAEALEELSEQPSEAEREEEVDASEDVVAESAVADTAEVSATSPEEVAADVEAGEELAADQTDDAVPSTVGVGLVQPSAEETMMRANVLDELRSDLEKTGVAPGTLTNGKEESGLNNVHHTMEGNVRLEGNNVVGAIGYDGQVNDIEDAISALDTAEITPTYGISDSDSMAVYPGKESRKVVDVRTDRDGQSIADAIETVGLSAIDTDANADEEIAFMEELHNPDEVLRLAEQAAAATLD